MERRQERTEGEMREEGRETQGEERKGEIRSRRQKRRGRRDERVGGEGGWRYG